MFGGISSTISVTLSVVLRSYVHVLYHSKASSCVLAVDKRQSLETLTREEKTVSQTLAQLSEKDQGFNRGAILTECQMRRCQAFCLLPAVETLIMAFLFNWNKELRPYK